MLITLNHFYLEMLIPFSSTVITKRFGLKLFLKMTTCTVVDSQAYL